MSSQSPRASPRYQRSFPALAGAMAVVVVFVLAVFVFQVLPQDHLSARQPTVDYSMWAHASRRDGRLATYVPHPMPRGWRATSAGYTPGLDPHWHLGILTPSQAYVGIEESYDTAGDLVHQYVSANASSHGTVLVGGHRWTAWQDSKGDYALVRSLGKERLLVVGTTPPAKVRAFAGHLRPAR